MPIDNDRTAEIVAVSACAGFLGMVGFAAHVIGYVVKEIDWRRLVGGMLFAGFTSAVSCMLLLATDMNPLYAAGISSILGASGEYGFNFLMETYIKRRDGGEN
jgi:hypothetical protein